MAKTKQKTKKSVAKRFRRTASGKIRRSCTGRGHLLGQKSRKRKRHLRAGAQVSPQDYQRIDAVLPR